MTPTSEIITRNEWSDGADVRMKFRRDGTGYYEREAAESRPFVHENLLWKLEGSTLSLKFAHARLWTEVQASTREGSPSEDGRYGHRVLELSRDPYAETMEFKLTASLVLQSDRGAPLPSN